MYKSFLEHCVQRVYLLDLSRFHGTCSDGTVGFTFHYDRMCRNGQGILGPLASMVRKCLDEMGYLGPWRGHHLILVFRLSTSCDPLRWIGEASFRWIFGFHIIGKLVRYLNCIRALRSYRLVVLLAATFTLLAQLCKFPIFVSLSISCVQWFRLVQRCWDMMLLLLRPLWRWAVTLATMSSFRIMMMIMTRIGTLMVWPLILILTVVAVLVGTTKPVTSYSAGPRFAVTEDASGVFTLALQILNALMKCVSAVALKALAFELMCVVEEIAASQAHWRLEKIDMVCEHDKARGTVEHLHKELAVGGK